MTRLPFSGSFLHFGVAVLSFSALLACTDDAVTGPALSVPTQPAMGKGVPQGPTVKSTDPDTAAIDTTLNVRVFGSGYDQGSTAKWAFKGVVSEKIVTNSTRFVSSTELVANITIARNANLGSHDVIVTTSTGKGGIGTELFVVTMKMTTLPTLGGTVGEAYAINDAGHIVGYSSDPAQGGFAVRWTQEGGIWTIRRIALNATRLGSEALAINEKGTAVGSLSGQYEAGVWLIDGTQISIGRGRANAINNFDVIAGSSGPFTASVWTPSGSGWQVRVLQLLAGVTAGACSPSDALGISDENVIVGLVTDAACVSIPVVWRPTADGLDWLPAERLSPVGTLAKGVAQAIVGSTVVGTGYPCASLNGCVRKAFRWILGGTSGPLGTLDARANGLNRGGDIVGSYVVKSGRMNGFVWSAATSIVFLTSLNGTGDNWAWDINDGFPRQAVGGVTLNSGGRRAAVWTIP